jgi:hypothetical protein
MVEPGIPDVPPVTAPFFPPGLPCILNSSGGEAAMATQALEENDGSTCFAGGRAGLLPMHGSGCRCLIGHELLAVLGRPHDLANACRWAAVS